MRSHCPKRQEQQDFTSAALRVSVPRQFMKVLLRFKRQSAKIQLQKLLMQRVNQSERLTLDMPPDVNIV